MFPLAGQMCYNIYWKGGERRVCIDIGSIFDPPQTQKCLQLCPSFQRPLQWDAKVHQARSTSKPTTFVVGLSIFERKEVRYSRFFALG